MATSSSIIHKYGRYATDPILYQRVLHAAPLGRLDPKQLPNVRSLGKGLSGFIYETTWLGRLGQGRYARKDFPLRSLRRSRVFEEEAKVLLELKHPNLVRCLGYTLGKSSSSLLQEYVDDDLQNVVRRRIEAQRVNLTSHSRVVDDIEEIKSLLSSKGKGTTGIDDGMPCTTLQFEMREAVDIISQIAAGMNYLHDKKIAHGDLKPKNVLLSLDESGKTKAVKIADYGLQGTKKLIRLVSKHTRHFEILTWKAPERFEELLGPVTEDSDHPLTDSDIDSDGDIGSYDDFLESSLAMADVYSFGLTCSYILGAKLLFPELSLTQLRDQRMHDFKRISLLLPPTCPKIFQTMIASCLKADPVSRPSFSAICNILKEVGGAYRSANTDVDIGIIKSGFPGDGFASDLPRGEMKAGFASHIYKGEMEFGSASDPSSPIRPMLMKLQMKVKMCCTKCEEKVVEEIRNVRGVFDVKANHFASKVVVLAMPPFHLDEHEVLRKARKIHRKANFVELDAEEKDDENKMLSYFPRPSSPRPGSLVTVRQPRLPGLVPQRQPPSALSPKRSTTYDL